MVNDLLTYIMIFGMLYDPLPDAEFILGRFREIKKELHTVFTKIKKCFGNLLLKTTK